MPSVTTLSTPAPGPPAEAAEVIDALLHRLDLPIAIVGTADGLPVAFNGVDQTTAERVNALYSVLAGHANKAGDLLGRGGMDTAVLRTTESAVVVMAITPASHLIMVVGRDEVHLAASRAATVMEEMARHLPEAIPDHVGASHLYVPGPQAVAG